MKYYICTTLLILLNFYGLKSYPGPSYDNNQNIRLAHQYLFALRPISAEKLLKTEELKNPGNGYVTFYRLYSNVITLMISNSPSEYSKKADDINQYVDDLKNLPDNSPDYRLLLGEAKVLAGLLKIKYDGKISGLISCLKGYNLLEENAARYPTYEQNKKIPGMIQVSVAFMPRILQWGIKLLGIKGDSQAGLKKLSEYSAFSKGRTGYEEEAFVFTMAAYKIMNQEDQLTSMISEKMDQFKDIALVNYIAATTTYDANEGELTLKLISNILPSKFEVPFPALNYLKGKTKMLRLDQDANLPLIDYLKEAPGTDYLKTTIYDLACFSYISGNIQLYHDYLNEVKSKGRELHNRDIEAAFEASKTELPNRILLSADYLVRGGYYEKAEHELGLGSENSFSDEKEKVQFYYLKAECKRLQKLVSEAESLYLRAFETGKSSGDYIAQKGLVQAGMMMEKNGSKAMAGKYYHLCLNFKAIANPYSDLFTNKARAGLIRLALTE